MIRGWLWRGGNQAQACTQWCQCTFFFGRAHGGPALPRGVPSSELPLPSISTNLLSCQGPQSWFHCRMTVSRGGGIWEKVGIKKSLKCMIRGGPVLPRPRRPPHTQRLVDQHDGPEAEGSPEGANGAARQPRHKLPHALREEVQDPRLVINEKYCNVFPFSGFSGLSTYF